MPVHEDAGNIEKYKLNLVGVRGSGKTVYLTMLKKHFDSYPGLGPGLDVKIVPPEAAAELERRYQEIIDEDAPWPATTDPTQFPEWHFRCYVNFKNQSYPILDIAFHDYSGELLKPRAGRDLELEERVRKLLAEGDGTLLLIDGEELLALMDDPDTEASFHRDRIEPMLEYARHSRYGVHVVITKWDLLEPRYKLKHVRKRLEAMDWFAHLVDFKRQEESPVRLIPVSALRDYVDPGEGTMTKRKGKRPQPFNVDIPFVSQMPDLLRRVKFLAEEAVEKAVAAGHEQVTLENLTGWTLKASSREQVAAGLAFAGMVGVVRLSRTMRRALRKAPVSLWMAKWRRPPLKKVHDPISAYVFTLGTMIWRMRQFTKDEKKALLAE